MSSGSNCFLTLIAGIVVLPVALSAQPKLEADAAGCVDSKTLPKLAFCRIDNCEKKDTDHRDIPTREDEKGEPVLSPIEGESHAVMYECREGTTPADILPQAATTLRAGGFEVPYQFVDKEGAVTAHKGDLWVTVEAASRYYTLVELKADSDLETASDAVAMGEALEKYGHVPLYGVHFQPGHADLEPESVLALNEVVALLNENPDLRVRIEGHTDNIGDKQANLVLSGKRATSVVTWLGFRGIKKTRLEVKALGDTQPVAANDNDANRARNRRIELVKITTP